MEEKVHEKKKFNWKWIVVVVVLVVLIWVVWIMFFSYADCEEQDCFDSYLESCNKAKFIGGTDMIFEYTIMGRTRDGCEVNVKLLQGELNNRDSRRIEMLEMVCTLPEGVIVVPESDIGRCTGLLKEGLQELVIKNLHTYLVQNLGRINLEVLGIPS